MTLVETLKYDWILKFESPKVLHSDCGRSFIGKEMKKLSERRGFDLEFSSPYHHSSNGQIERQFRTVRDCLMTKLKDVGLKDWAKYLPEVEYMMNATFQKSINTSPAEEVFERKLRRTNLKNKRPSYEDSETRRSFEVGEQVWVKKEMKNKEDD